MAIPAIIGDNAQWVRPRSNGNGYLAAGTANQIFDTVRLAQLGRRSIAYQVFAGTITSSGVIRVELQYSNDGEATWFAAKTYSLTGSANSQGVLIIQEPFASEIAPSWRGFINRGTVGNSEVLACGYWVYNPRNQPQPTFPGVTVI